MTTSPAVVLEKRERAAARMAIHQPCLVATSRARACGDVILNFLIAILIATSDVGASTVPTKTALWVLGGFVMRHDKYTSQVRFSVWSAVRFLALAAPID
jgi:hypothetical protein